MDNLRIVIIRVSVHSMKVITSLLIQELCDNTSVLEEELTKKTVIRQKQENGGAFKIVDNTS